MKRTRSKKSRDTVPVTTDTEACKNNKLLFFFIEYYFASSVIYRGEWHFLVADVFLKRNTDKYFFDQNKHNIIEALCLLFLYLIFTHIQYRYCRFGPAKMTILCFLSRASWNLKLGKKRLWETTVTWNWADLSIIRYFSILQLRRIKRGVY
jgi:hypothetical protein